MQNTNYLVFSDVDSYLLSLPRRLASGTTGEVIALYTKPFWAKKQSITLLAQDCEINRRKVQSTRKLIRYLAAPTASGKTACLLPAFLDSVESQRVFDGEDVAFTYYLYLAFGNNESRAFKVGSNLNPDATPVDQGAFFMQKCLMGYLSGNYESISLGNRTFPRFDDSVKAMETLIQDATGKNSKCLVHVDEYRRMLMTMPPWRQLFFERVHCWRWQK